MSQFFQKIREVRVGSGEYVFLKRDLMQIQLPAQEWIILACQLVIQSVLRATHRYTVPRDGQEPDCDSGSDILIAISPLVQGRQYVPAVFRVEITSSGVLALVLGLVGGSLPLPPAAHSHGAGSSCSAVAAVSLMPSHPAVPYDASRP